MDNTAQIIPYQGSWPLEFSKIGVILRHGLGSLALRIDHIGSTSVPGLAAKDVIDIQVTVTRLDEAVQRAMTRLGYVRAADVTCDHHPPLVNGEDVEWEKWYFRPPAGQRPTHVHMRVYGRHNQRYPLLFRDYLRAHPATAEAYAELKRRLAQNLPNREVYTDVKDPAVDLVYLAAEEWAAAIHWVPGVSDA